MITVIIGLSWIIVGFFMIKKFRYFYLSNDKNITILTQSIKPLLWILISLIFYPLELTCWSWIIICQIFIEHTVHGDVA